MSGHNYLRAYSIDCEMADVEDVFSGVGRAKKFPIKVVIVDEHLDVIYDRFIRPESTVLNDNAFIHGINLKSVIPKAIPFGRAQSEVDQILHGNLVVGHDLDQDLKALDLHSEVSQDYRRDTACAKIFIRWQPPPSRGWQKPKLADLAREHLNISIQETFHDAVEDAITAMKLYKKFKTCSASDWAKPEKNNW